MFYNLLADKNGDAKTFTDVPANQWYAKAVMTLADKGVSVVIPMGHSNLMRLLLVQNMWHYDAIVGATQNGWISSYPDDTFDPDRYITRAEVTSVNNRMENRAADMSFMMDHLDEIRIFSDLSFGHWAVP